VSDPANEAIWQRIPEEARQQARYWMNNRSTISPAEINARALEIKQLTEGAGLAFCSLASYLGVHQYAEIEAVMQAAQVMGCPRVRVHTPSYDRSRSYNELYAETVGHLREVERLAKRYGLAADVETHFGNITASAALMHRLVSHFDPEHVGVIYDPGNMVYEGYECWKMGFELLGPYLHEVHAKNAHWTPVGAGAPGALGMGPKPTDKQLADGTTVWAPNFTTMWGGFANWQQIMEDLAAVGYDGWIAFEDFSETGLTLKEKCAANLAYLRNYEG
jgi:sugar phosphate isomerase/epimerase